MAVAEYDEKVNRSKKVAIFTIVNEFGSPKKVILEEYL